MVNFWGIHIGKAKEGAPEEPSPQKQMDRLQKQVIADNKLAKTLAESDPWIRAIYTPKIYPVKDVRSKQTFYFDDVKWRMAAANYTVTRFCAPSARGGSRPERKMMLTNWRRLYTKFKHQCAAKERFLKRNYWNNLPEMARKWEKFVNHTETQFLPGFDYVWDDRWLDEDVQPAWSMFYQEMPNMNQGGGSGMDPDTTKKILEAMTPPEAN